MTAPSVASIGTINSGTGATRTPGVPSGVTGAGFFRLIIAGVNANAVGSVATFSDLFLTASASLPNINVHYGISTVSESGNYAVTVNSGINNADVQAARISDVATVFGTVSTPAPANSSTPPATSLTNVPADSLLVWVAYTQGNRFTAMPTGFTRQSANNQIRHHWGTMVHNPGGSGVSDVTVNTGQIEAPAGTPLAIQHRTALFALVPVLNYNGGASLTETIVLSSTGQLGVSTGAALAASVVLTASGLVGLGTGASLAEAATLTAAGVTGIQDGASLAAAATLTASGDVALSSAATLPIVTEFAATGSLGVGAEAALATNATLTASGQLAVGQGANLTVTAALTAAGIAFSEYEAPINERATITESGVESTITSPNAKAVIS